MEPRLKSSIKWTPFPEEFLEQIQSSFEEFFESYELNEKSFRVQGAIYPEEILLRVGLNSPHQLRQDNLEASMEINPQEEKALEQIHKIVDFIAQVWEDLLEDEENPSELPRRWQPFPWENKKIFLKYSTTNTDLEAQADALLNLDDKQLVYGSEEIDFEDPEINKDMDSFH